MTYYRYTAIDQLGRQQRGCMDVPSEQSLVECLQQQELELLTYKLGQPLFRRRPRVNSAVLIVFCIQMEQLLQAGVPLLQAIAELAEQSEHKGLRAALRILYRDLEAGRLLSQAFQAQANIFPPLFGQLVDAGERTGQLSEIFGHLTRTLSWQAELLAQIRRGLTYPAVLCVMVAVAAYVMLTFLVPQMASFLQGLGQELPWSTRLLLTLSDGVMAYGGWLLLGMVLLVGALILIVRHSPKAALLLDQCLLKIPVFGRLLHQLVLARLCRFLGLMYQTGIPLLQALEWCQPLLQQRVMALALADVHQRVQAGESLTSSFKATLQFPPLMLRMLSVGETTGALDRMLLQLAAFYDREVQSQLQTLLRLLEPALTISLGLMLLFLMAAVMLPVYDSFSSLRY
ncbi:MAG: type II secretion system F family protein [Microcystis aeruginosa DA14]|uniref:Type II secretion system F family protein n=1 Tax=Microcystis aeruginosa DA14 TaxID=1987506 RepID=A0A3E0M7S5_MICAE|nr:MAG: type II secretion system F family protein [Microcystis aeruginosa DA14]